jgi:excisionase family DNA binding protein
MSLSNRLRQLVDALPSDSSSVTLTRSDLAALLEGEEQGGEVLAPERDLTVEQVAEAMGRACSTVRGWLIAGELRGFKLNGRDWRVPRAALRAYRDAQAAGKADPEPEMEGVDISAWRRVS